MQKDITVDASTIEGEFFALLQEYVTNSNDKSRNYFYYRDPLTWLNIKNLFRNENLSSYKRDLADKGKAVLWNLLQAQHNIALNLVKIADQDAQKAAAYLNNYLRYSSMLKLTEDLIAENNNLLFWYSFNPITRYWSNGSLLNRLIVLKQKLATEIDCNEQYRREQNLAILQLGDFPLVENAAIIAYIEVLRANLRKSILHLQTKNSDKDESDATQVKIMQGEGVDKVLTATLDELANVNDVSCSEKNKLTL